MDTPAKVLGSLCESVEEREVEEGLAGSVAKLSLGAFVVNRILGPSKPGKTGVLGKQTIGVLELAKSLVNAKDQQQEIAAVVGLLELSFRIMRRVPSLRDLAFKIQKVVDDERLEEFLK